MLGCVQWSIVGASETGMLRPRRGSLFMPLHGQILSFQMKSRAYWWTFALGHTSRTFRQRFLISGTIPNRSHSHSRSHVILDPAFYDHYQRGEAPPKPSQHADAGYKISWQWQWQWLWIFSQRVRTFLTKKIYCLSKTKSFDFKRYPFHLRHGIRSVISEVT